MKLAELAKTAAVPKETIQYYLREGLLPRPPMRGKRLAEYDESYVELIRQIRQLQEQHYLPISVIKRIVTRQKKISKQDKAIFRLQSEYFTPALQLLPREINGEEEFCGLTGMNPACLARFEEWGLLTPRLKDGAKVYSAMDMNLAKLLVEMDRLGLGPGDGFPPEPLRQAAEHLRDAVGDITAAFSRTYYEELGEDEFYERGVEALEVLGIYFYHLFRKFAVTAVTAEIRSLKDNQPR